MPIWGKSAVLIGGDVGQGETFTVLDLFGAQADTPANAAENEDQYPSLTRSRFEENYLKVHDALPSVIQAPSSQVLDHVSSGSHRFVHVDASHLYEHVVGGDVRASRELSAPQGSWRSTTIGPSMRSGGCRRLCGKRPGTASTQSPSRR